MGEEFEEDSQTKQLSDVGVISAAANLARVLPRRLLLAANVSYVYLARSSVQVSSYGKNKALCCAVAGE